MAKADASEEKEASEEVKVENAVKETKPEETVKENVVPESIEEVKNIKTILFEFL